MTDTARCLLDDDPCRARPVDGPRSLVCKQHRARLVELLDPDQRGQMHVKPGERRVPASIPVLYGLLPYLRTRSSDQQGGRTVPRSTPPGDLRAATHRDHRSHTAGSKYPGDDESDAPLSALGTLTAIARRLDLRDVHGQAVPLPRVDPPSEPVVAASRYRDVIGLAGALLWERYRPRPVPPHDPVRDLCAWLHHRLDHLCAADWVDAAFDDLRLLSSQLRAATGDPAPRPIGPCRQLVDHDGAPWRHEPIVGVRDDGPFECGVPLHMPTLAPRGMDEPVALPSVRCTGCGWTYTGSQLTLLAARAQKAAS